MDDNGFHMLVLSAKIGLKWRDKVTEHSFWPKMYT